MVAVKKLTMYLIPLIVLVISTMGYFGDDGMLGAIGDVGRGIKDAAPNVSVGMEKLQAEHEEPPGPLAAQLNSFTDAIEAMLNSSETNCFGSHIPFDDLGTDGWFEDPKSVRVSFNYDPETGNTTYRTSHTNGYVYDMKELKMKLCVVAGHRVNGYYPSFNFFRNFIHGDSNYNSTKKYSEIHHLRFGFEDSRHNGNRIRVLGSGFEEGEDPVNDESDNYESGGLLYKPKDDLICFFPTNFDANHDHDGIENDWLNNRGYVESERRSLSFRLRVDPFDDVKYCDQSRNVIPDYTAREAWEFAASVDDDVDYGDYREFIDHISPSSSCDRCGGNSITIFTDDDWEEISGDGFWDIEEEFDYITKCLEKKLTLSNPTSTSCSLSFAESAGIWFADTCEDLLGSWICGAPDEPDDDD